LSNSPGKRVSAYAGEGQKQAKHQIAQEAGTGVSKVRRDYRACDDWFPSLKCCSNMVLSSHAACYLQVIVCEYLAQSEIESGLVLKGWHHGRPFGFLLQRALCPLAGNRSLKIENEVQALRIKAKALWLVSD
jgi:hypothetical protein